MEKKEKVIIGSDGKIYRPIKTSKEIEVKIKELALQIKKDYSGKTNPPILLFVMTGGLYLGVDLSRALIELGFKSQVDTIALKRNYIGDDNMVEILSHPRLDLGNRDVIVVEDLIDEGLSMNFLHTCLEGLDNPPKSIEYCTLFIKEHHEKLLFEVKYLAWYVTSNWLIGNGMDDDSFYRDLVDVYQSET